MRRKDREMPREFALEVLDSCLFATIAVIDDKNMPYCLPINIARDGDSIYFHCAKVGFKIDALKNNNNVCVSCTGKTQVLEEKFTTQYQSAIARGCAFEIFDQDEKIHALRLLCEKFTPSNMRMFEREISQHLSHTAVWRIDISQISGKSNF